jgi:hypothetical protein
MDKTYNSLVKNVLRPLNGEISFCVSSSATVPSEVVYDSDNSCFVEEPRSWNSAFNEAMGSNNWMKLLDLGLGKELLGGAEDSRTVGSGGIIMWFRVVLGKFAADNQLESKFDWFAIVRSDFLWEFPLPRITSLDPNKIYLLDGEKYEGVSDRFILFSRRNAHKVFSMGNDLFSSSDDFVARVRHKTELHGTQLNPEKYLALQIDKLGLSVDLVFLPYNGWAIRRENTKTRWSLGVYSKRLGLYVKYPGEYFKAKLGKRLGLGSKRQLLFSAAGKVSLRRRVVNLTCNFLIWMHNQKLVNFFP